MNKKVLYLLLILVLVCSVVFAACDDETVTITYNYNYQGAPEDKVVTLEIDAEITLETPTRSGYTFDGWFIDASCVTSFAQTVASQSVTLYAKWTEIHTHSLRYEHTDSKHWQECDCGHTTAQQDHQFDENNACVCGYVQSAVHTHSWATEWSNDDTNHWKVCSGCAELNEKATHDTNGVDGACSVCGYKTAVVVEPVVLYFYNANDWEQVYAYSWLPEALGTYPGTQLSAIAEGSKWYSVQMDATVGGFQFNNGKSGTEEKKTGDLTIQEGKPYFYSGTWYATQAEADEAIAQPPVTTYVLKGSFNNWGSGEPVVFEPHSETEVKLLGFELAAGAEFKVVISVTGQEDEWIGTLKDGVTVATYSADGNITVANAGKYDLYFDIQAKQLWIVATHEHSWATEFSSDATHHWYACDCAEVKDKAEHVPGAAATETTPQICTVCQRVLVPELGHVHVGVEHTANPATCVDQGNSAYWSCACGKYFSDSDCQNEIAENSWVIPATGEHNYVDGTCDCGAKAPVTVYFYIADMASVNAYTWTSAGNPLSTWPGVAMTPVADDEGWFSIEIAGIADNIIFNWNDGRGQTADLVVADGPYFYNNQGFATKEAAEQAIALPVETMYLLRGTFNGWGDGAIIIFEPHSETEVKLIGFELEAGAEFKVVISSTGSLDEWVGTLKDGVTDATYSEGGNITVANAGKYDLYFDIQAKQLWISAHGHSYGEWANGTDDDANNHIRSCVCGEIESHPANYANWALATEGDNQGKHVGTCSCGLVLAHEPSANADDNDCTTAIVCSVCNLEMTPAKSHDYDNDCDTNCNNAGCTAGDRTTSHQVGGWTYSDDFTQRWHQCSVCGNKADLQAHAHASDTLLFRNDYQEQYKVCADCNQEFDVATHTHSGGSASCGNQAVCSVCMQKYGEFVDHVPQEIEGKAPTCTETGLTVGSKCSSCEQIITEQQTIDALGHTWEDPNCTIPRTCSVCNLTEGQAAGHSYQSVVTPPTCTEGGYTTHTCSVCDDTYTDAQTVAAGHSWVDATCTAPKTCSVCDLTEGTALGHDYAEVVTAPTCTEGGYTTYTCGTCNDSYVDDEVDAAGHDYEAVVTPPTCTAEGFTTHTCSKCDDSYVDSTVGMVAHDYVNFVCSVCGVNNYVVKGIAGDWSVGVPLVANPGNQNEVMLLAVELAENATFKIYINDNSIEENERWIGALKDGVTVATYSASGNIFVAAAGKYDLYFDLGVKQLWIAAHSHVSTGTYASDENGHWVVCACGENVLQGEHSGADDGDCTTAINCSVCNYELTAGNANHSLSADWSSDATNHWHACTNADCLATGEVNAHVAGPEATETTPQICTVCQKILAPVTTHTHVGVEHAAIAATCTTAGNSAYWSCACGKYFSDADCQNEIAENSWVIAATGEHNYVDGACVCGSRVIYFVPNSDWNQAGARFAAYFFEGSDTVWVDLTDEDGDGTYQVVVPEGYTNVIICRMNPSTTENNWDNRWNQTGDLTVPTDSAVLYTVPNGTWDGSDNTHWSTL